MSEQLALAFQVGRREFVLRKVLENIAGFRPDFYEWLKSNLDIWERFEAEANSVHDSGRPHYSARTIGEFIRHETALKSANDGAWKINNNRFPDLARVYALMYPKRAEFFEFRGRDQMPYAMTG